MKNLKKLILAGLFLLLPFFFLFVFSPVKALAAVDPSDITKGSYTFQDGGNIEGVFSASGNVNFFDQEPLDSDRNFNPESDSFCQPGGVARSDWGINVDKNADLTAAKIPAKLIVGYVQGATCIKQVLDITIDNPNVNATRYFEWDGENIVTLNGAKDAKTFTAGENVPALPSGTASVYISEAGNDCKADGLILLSTDSSGTYYKLRGVSYPDAQPNVPDELKNYLSTSKCHIDSKFSINLKGSPSQAAPPGGNPTTPPGGGTTCSEGNFDACLQGGGDSDVCISKSLTSLEWILCPIINATSKFTDQINNFVEGQLHFRVGQLLPDSGQVNKAWVIIKNIVSGLVVILMLVMVISQAVGGQFFDAYTVKKMLPRLVIAVIAMQFSWVLGKWLITTANDLGEGLKQIMLAPFGGSGNMDLASIMHHLNGAYPAVTGVAIYGVIIGFIFIKGAEKFILPILLFVILAVGSALIVALATLVFRNILIIMAVIFAPLALLLWATPGQTMQGYWKKYADNFAKLLLFFPLVVALIYSGRIGAWLAGNMGAPSLMEYFIVLVAFFGPYFFLPKTFRWGGQLLGAISQGLSQNKILNSAKNWGYGRIGAMAKQRRDDIAYGWSREEEKWHGEKQELPTSRWWQRGRFGKYSGLRGLTTKVDKEGVKRGRKLPGVGGRRVKQYLGGALFEKGLSLEGLLARGEERKKVVDTAAATEEQRGLEYMRDRKGAVLFNYIGPDGRVRTAAIMAGTGPFSDTAGQVSRLEDLNSPYAKGRLAGQTAVEMLNDPRGHIFLSHGLVPLDATDERVRRKELAEAHFRSKGFRGLRKPYNADDPGRDDVQLLAQMRSLKERQANGETLSEDEMGDLRHLQVLYDTDVAGGMRLVNLQRRSAAFREQVQKNIDTIESTAPGQIVEAEGDNIFATDENGNPLPENRKVRYVPPTAHNQTQRKVTSNLQAWQNLSGIDPENIPEVLEAMQLKGLGFAVDQNAETMRGIDEALDQYVARGGKSTVVDQIRELLAEQMAAPRMLEHESTSKRRAGIFPKLLANYDIGLAGPAKYGDVGLTAGGEFLRRLVENIIQQDGDTLRILSSKRWQRSLKAPFNQWLGEGTTIPADLLHIETDIAGKPIPLTARPVLDIKSYVEQHRDRRPAWASLYKEEAKLRHQMGIPIHSAKLANDRDALILSILPYFQHYDRSLTAERFRFETYDQDIDPEGAEDMHYIAESPVEYIKQVRRAGMGDFVFEPRYSALTRKRMAEDALGMVVDARGEGGLSPQQTAAVQSAHMVGAGEIGRDGRNPAGIDNYTDAQLREKDQILQAGGFEDAGQRRILIEQGIVGGAEDAPPPATSSPTPVFSSGNTEIDSEIKAASAQMEQLAKQYTQATKEQRKAMSGSIKQAASRLKAVQDKTASAMEDAAEISLPGIEMPDVAAGLPAGAQLDAQALATLARQQQAVQAPPPPPQPSAGSAPYSPASVSTLSATTPAKINYVTQQTIVNKPVTQIVQPKTAVSSNTLEGSTVRFHSQRPGQPVSGELNWDSQKRFASELGYQIRKGIQEGTEAAIKVGGQQGVIRKNINTTPIGRRIDETVRRQGQGQV